MKILLELLKIIFQTHTNSKGKSTIREIENILEGFNYLVLRRAPIETTWPWALIMWSLVLVSKLVTLAKPLCTV
jgi:hypothetical protein